MDIQILKCYYNNQQLTITVDENSIKIENQKTQFVYPLDLKTQLKWKIQDGKLNGFVIYNQVFDANHTVLVKFKQMIGGKTTFRSIYDFFTVIQKSGNGAFSSVYNVMPIQGLSQDVNQIMVLKRIDKSNVDIATIHQEIKNLLLCQSKNVVKLVEVYENQLSVFIVMEKLNHINPVDLTECKVINYAKEIISAVLDLHKLEIIHRDLKFHNIMVDSEDKIKIIDFGLSCTQNRCFQKCGTLGYIAPEIIFNYYYDQKCDMFSVGVLLYQLFNYVYNKQMIKMIDFYDKNLYLNFPVKIQQLLKRLLEVNPDYRFSSEQAYGEIQQICEIDQSQNNKIIIIDQ